MITQTDPLLGRACAAYNLQVALSPETRARLAQAQDRILARAKSPLWRCPVLALHVSLTPFLSVRSEYGGRKEELWQENCADWMRRSETCVQAVGEWTIHYNKIRLTETAIFALGEDGDVTNSIRRQLALPESEGMSWVHTTLFRFASSYQLPSSEEDLIRAEPVEIEERVTEIVIVKETIYPSIAHRVIKRLMIGASTQ